MGRFIRRLRGLSAVPSERLSYRAHSGFAYTYTQGDVERLAHDVGRGIAWEQGDMQPFHYVTFLPTRSFCQGL